MLSDLQNWTYDHDVLSPLIRALSTGSDFEQVSGQVDWTQSCNEDSSKILVEGRWYWIHDFVPTYRVNDRPIDMALCS